MKDREDFLASVYAKRDAALAKEKKHKKRMMSGLTAAAACLVLMVSVTSGGLDRFAGGGMMEGSADGAAVESMVESEAPSNDAMNAADDFMVEDGFTDGDSASPSAMPGQSAVSQETAEDDSARKDIYDIETDKYQDVQYYCLPCVTIEGLAVEGEAAAMHASGIEEVKKVQAWVDGLMEQGQGVNVDGRLEDAIMLKMDQVTCIVTIEWEPQQKEIYYLTGEVGWYE